MSKTEYLERPSDIDLGPTFNAMRLRQRVSMWPQYQMNCAMQNVLGPQDTGYGHYGILGEIFGLSAAEPYI